MLVEQKQLHSEGTQTASIFIRLRLSYYFNPIILCLRLSVDFWGDEFLQNQRKT